MRHKIFLFSFCVSLVPKFTLFSAKLFLLAVEKVTVLFCVLFSIRVTLDGIHRGWPDEETRERHKWCKEHHPIQLLRNAPRKRVGDTLTQNDPSRARFRYTYNLKPQDLWGPMWKRKIALPIN